MRAGVEETPMTKTRDFMTMLLARFKVTHTSKLKSTTLSTSQPLPKRGKSHVARQVPAYRPKPPTYRPASNM